MLVERDLHVVELDLHAVEQRIVVCGARRDLVERVDHLDDAVQDALGQHQAQVAGRGVERRREEGIAHAVRVGAAAADQIAEALHDDAAAEHVAQPRDALAVAVGILKWLGEVLGHQQREVGVLGLPGRVLIAVAVDGDDAVGVLVDDRAPGVHAEGAHQVTVLFRAVDDLALVELVRQMGEDLRGQLHAHADVHAVGLGGNVQLPAHALHPFAADAADGDHAIPAGILLPLRAHLIAALDHLHALHRRIEEEVDLLLQLGIEVFQHHIVDVRTQMAHRRIEQVQVVLDAELLELRASSGIQLRALAAIAQVDLVDVAHQLQRLCLSNVLVQRAAEVVGDVVLAVGERARAAEAAHDRAAFAADTRLDLLAVDRAMAL